MVLGVKMAKIYFFKHEKTQFFKTRKMALESVKIKKFSNRALVCFKLAQMTH